MPVAIQIRNVPDATRDALAAEAEARGQSLQLFLADVLEREAASARNRAWVRGRRGVTPVPSGGPTTRELIEAGHGERDRAILDAVGLDDVPVTE
jgi:hypothetical protein